jgi:deazaflavin-dependent oxidoreductase (nitroreductase family)
MLGPRAKSPLIPDEELLKNVPALEPAVADEDYCYLTTTGRVSGEPREIEIWFGLDGATVYLLSGGGDRSNWVRNLRRDPVVTVRIAGTTWPGRARIVEDADEDERARTLLVDKYTPGYSGNLDDWRRRSLPVAIDLEASDD